MTQVALAGGGMALVAIETGAEHVGLAVNVGVRPEDLAVTEAAEFVAQGTVDFVEELGEVTLLYLKAEHGSDDPVIAKLPGSVGTLHQSQVRFSAPPEKLHLFHNGQSMR